MRNTAIFRQIRSLYMFKLPLSSSSSFQTLLRSAWRRKISTPSPLFSAAIRMHSRTHARTHARTHLIKEDRPPQTWINTRPAALPSCHCVGKYVGFKKDWCIVIIASPMIGLQHLFTAGALLTGWRNIFVWLLSGILNFRRGFSIRVFDICTI